MGYYRTAQICLNGHCITSALEEYPEQSQAFCSNCGAATLTACTSCGSNIRGNYYDDFDCCVLERRVPAYCHHCGKPYPWTQTALDAAADLIREEEALSSEQQENLVSVLPDIVAETPKTNLAVVRMKKALAAAGKFTVDALRSFAIDFGCELAKQQLGL